MPGSDHHTDGRSIAIGHGHALRLPIAKHEHAFAWRTDRVSFEAQPDRAVPRASWVVVSADREKPDAGLIEPLHLPLDREFRLEREQGIVVEIARGEDGVEPVVDRVVDRVLEGFERGAPQALASGRPTSEARLEVEVSEV
jgi:hypothetical protein